MIEDLWYKNAIIHGVHVGTCMDSNGDGSRWYRAGGLGYLLDRTAA